MLSLPDWPNVFIKFRRFSAKGVGKHVSIEATPSIIPKFYLQILHALGVASTPHFIGYER